MATCKLVNLFPTAVTLDAPGDGLSYVVYKVGGFSESGIHGFTRAVEAMGPALGQSSIPLETAEKVGLVTAAIVRALEDKKITVFELGQIIGSIKGLQL